MIFQAPCFEYQVKMYSILVQILPGLENGSLTVNLTIRTLNWVVCEASIVLIQLSTPIIKTFHYIFNVKKSRIILLIIQISSCFVIFFSSHFKFLFTKFTVLLIQAVQFSCSVVSNSLQPHELQHARPPCPSPTPGVHSNSRPSSQ